MVSQFLEYFNHICIIATSTSQLFWNSNPKGSFSSNTLDQLVTRYTGFFVNLISVVIQPVDKLF